VIEVMLNPDGRLWLGKVGRGCNDLSEISNEELADLAGPATRARHGAEVTRWAQFHRFGSTPRRRRLQSHEIERDD
jgi:hypothetical protein